MSHAATVAAAIVIVAGVVDVVDVVPPASARNRKSRFKIAEKYADGLSLILISIPKS